MKHFFALSILSGLNLLFMHYSVIYSSGVTFPWDITSFFDNILAILFDLVLILSASYILALRKIKIALIISFIITLSWAISNVIYARFFYMYLPLSVFQEANNIFDDLLLKNIISGIEWYDTYFIIAIILFYYEYRKTSSTGAFSFIKRSWYILFSLIIITIALHACYTIIYMPSFDNLKWRIVEKHYSKRTHTLNPNYSTYSRGIIRTKIIELADFIQKDENIPSEVVTQIKAEIENNKGKISNVSIDSQEKNIIMIIVESFMSFTLNMSINGKEVTPFLNSLMHNDNVYFNGQMKPNITIGQSSDGQFIYMTGLLPLKSILTISKAKDKTLPALPHILKKYGYISRIIIPTSPSIWSQDKMSEKYGFNTMLSIYDYNNGNVSDLNDAQVFDIAKKADQETKQPFFSVILTLSTHEPYDKIIDNSFKTDDPSLPQTMQCYLNACHYTDKQIQEYFLFLKRNHLYENSTIIILSDHHARENKLDMTDNMSKEYIPIFIVNLGNNIEEGWQRECNQIDVFTTLTDIFKLETTWRGLGHSMFSNDFSPNITEDQWCLSEWIINGNYFKNNPY